MVLRASWAMHGLVNGLVHGSMVTGGVDMVAGKVVCWGSGVVCNETDSMLSNFLLNGSWLFRLRDN